MSEILEEQDPRSPACFAARIRREPPVPHFQLPRGTKTYDGNTRPEDWLSDYVSAMSIAGENRRWALRYIPCMLEGPVKISLNSLKPNSIEGWVDFEDLFNSNFSSTYQKLNSLGRSFIVQWASGKSQWNGTSWHKAPVD